MDDEEMQEDLTKIQQWIEKNIKSENHQKKMLTENFPPLKTEKTLNQNQRRNKNKKNYALYGLHSENQKKTVASVCLRSNKTKETFRFVWSAFRK